MQCARTLGGINRCPDKSPPTRRATSTAAVVCIVFVIALLPRSNLSPAARCHVLSVILRRIIHTASVDGGLRVTRITYTKPFLRLVFNFFPLFFFCFSSRSFRDNPLSLSHSRHHDFESPLFRPKASRLCVKLLRAFYPRTVRVRVSKSYRQPLSLIIITSKSCTRHNLHTYKRE